MEMKMVGQIWRRRKALGDLRAKLLGQRDWRCAGSVARCRAWIGSGFRKWGVRRVNSPLASCQRFREICQHRLTLASYTWSPCQREPPFAACELQELWWLSSERFGCGKSLRKSKSSCRLGFWGGFQASPLKQDEDAIEERMEGAEGAETSKANLLILREKQSLQSMFTDTLAAAFQSKMNVFETSEASEVTSSLVLHLLQCEDSNASCNASCRDVSSVIELLQAWELEARWKGEPLTLLCVSVNRHLRVGSGDPRKHFLSGLLCSALQEFPWLRALTTGFGPVFERCSSCRGCPGRASGAPVFSKEPEDISHLDVLLLVQ